MGWQNGKAAKKLKKRIFGVEKNDFLSFLWTLKDGRRDFEYFYWEKAWAPQISLSAFSLSWILKLYFLHNPSFSAIWTVRSNRSQDKILEE